MSYTGRPPLGSGGVFCFVSRFYVAKITKNQKNEKKCKKMQKNLHISKKSCNFAPDFKTRRSETLKKKQKKVTKL